MRAYLRLFAAVDGSPISVNPVAVNLTSTSPNPRQVAVVACATGESIVAWTSEGTGGSLRAQRLTASGSIRWNSGGIAVCAHPSQVPGGLFAISDGSDGIYCVYSRVGSSSSYWFAMRVEADGDLAMLSGSLISATDIPVDEGGALALTCRAPSVDAGENLPEVTGYNVWRLTGGASANESLRSAPVSNEDALAALERSLRSTTRLTAAQAQRLRFPPGSWESLGFHAAVLDSQYRFIVATRNDSGPLIPNADETFVVTAHTSSPSNFGISNAIPGHSRDNLAPAAPQQLTGALAAGSLRLDWAANGEADLSGYRIYRGTTAGFIPSPANLRGSASLPSHDDGAFVSGSWYQVSAIDRHGNESAVATLSPSAVTDAGSPPAHVDFLRMPSANPVRGELAVEFGLRSAGDARVTLLDAQGRVVALLADGAFEAGPHRLSLAGRSTHAGLYFVRIEANGFVAARKVVLAD